MCMNIHNQDHSVGSIADFIEMFPASLPYIELPNVLDNPHYCLCGIDVKGVLDKIGIKYTEDAMGDLTVI